MCPISFQKWVPFKLESCKRQDTDKQEKMVFYGLSCVHEWVGIFLIKKQGRQLSLVQNFFLDVPAGVQSIY